MMQHIWLVSRRSTLRGLAIAVWAALISVASLSALSAQSLADLRKAQEQTRAHLDRIMAATVGIHLEDSSGSGVIVTEDGYILTAAHVIMQPGETFEVELTDGRKVKAKSLGMDHDWDAGLAKIESKEGEKWPHVPLALQSPTPGDWCLATGHPGGIFHDRKPPLRLGRVLMVGDGTDPLDGIQTDATVYPGDSGGPLFNLQGEVIGIHSNIGLDVLENQHVPVEIYQMKWDDFVAGKTFGEPVDLLAEELPTVFDFIPGSLLGLYDTISSWFFEDPEWFDLTKDSPDTLAGAETLTTPLRKSIVDVVNGETPVALGVAVSRKGLVLTKLSVLKGELGVVINDEVYKAHIAARLEEYDLALLQIEDAPKLKPITFAAQSPRPGAWVVTPDVDASPLSIGVVSNPVTKVEAIAPPRGAMKVEVADADGGGVHIKRVMYGGPAAKAGMRVDDRVVEFEGTKLDDAEALFKQMEKTKPGQEVGLKVKRGETEVHLKMKLVIYADEDEEYSGILSERRAGFPSVFAHDTAIVPEACGSPLLDLDGNVIGLNIARAGRVTTYAIPGDVLQKLVPTMLEQAKKSERKLAKKEAKKAAAAKEADKPMPASQLPKADAKPVVPTPAPQAP